jgi:Uma2 family endonuclease
MATPVLIPVSEYLNTTYRPDCDYIDGELKERNVGEKPHGLLQGILFSVFFNHRKKWNLVPITEQRVQTGQSSYRIPDVCVIRPVAGQDVVQTPPVLCIEILSRRDTLASIRDRIDDYLEMGVQAIWIFDPVKRLVHRASASGYERFVGGELTIVGTEIRVDIAALFQDLDELLAGPR